MPAVALHAVNQNGRACFRDIPAVPREDSYLFRRERKKLDKKKKKGKTSRKNVAKNIGMFFLTCLLVFMTSAAICGMVFAIYIHKYINPEIDVDLNAVRLNLTSFIYYEDKETGETKELEKLYGIENRVWADIDEMPKLLQEAFISIEDARFMTHNGVDWKRTLGAGANFVLHFRDNFGGGSTITQQLIKNLTGEDETSVKRKLQEVMRALELEKKYEKSDILELYLNTIYFGQGAYGVKSAAQVYFGKELSELTLGECAAIAGITKNPYGYDPFRFPEKNKERQELVLKEMLKYGKISQEEHDAAVAQKLDLKKDEAEQSRKESQSYFVDAVIEQVISDLKEQKGYSETMAKTMVYNGGLQIITTIDVDVQKQMDAVFCDLENFPGKLGKDGTMPQGAMVIMDPYTGRVVAMYGGRGVKEGNRIFNRATKAYRSPGSSIKPLSVYAPGLEYGVITPWSVLDDVPKNFSVRASGWPKNEVGYYTGRMTVMKAVERSFNTLPIEILDKVGLNKAFNFARTNLGLTSLVERRVKTMNDGSEKVYSDIDYGPLALGGLTDGVTVLEMTAAYSAFVNNGIYTEPYIYSKVLDANGEVILDNEPVQTPSMSAKTATYMVEILKNVVTGSQGTGRKAALGNGIEVGGKTGTTDDSYDRWFAGITPYYTGVVWFGYDKQQDVGKFSTNPALTLWKAVMSRVHEGLEARSFSTSVELKSCTICADSGLLTTEWCQNDVRGSRAIKVKLAPEDVPTQKCNLHVPVEVDGETNGIANEFCPLDKLKTVGMLKLQREFPTSGVVVRDQQYLIPYDPSAGMFLPLTEDRASSSAPICTVHSIENDGNTLPEPEPTDPDPGDPDEPTDPDNPDVPTEPGHTDPSTHQPPSTGPTTPSESKRP